MSTFGRLKGIAGYLRVEAECGYYGMKMMSLQRGYNNAQFSLEGLLEGLDELDSALDVAEALDTPLQAGMRDKGSFGQEQSREK